MTTTRRRMRLRGPDGRLDAAMVPTPLEHGDDEPVRFDPPVTRPMRSPMVVAALVSLAIRLWLLRLTRRLDADLLGRELAAFCLRMGVLWMKVAQLLSTRVDLIPREVADQLARLRDRAAGVPGAVAARVVEEELGAPLAHVFAEFEAEPFAAASIAQVHRARLKTTGAAVVVKVRRPGVEQAFASDMRLLRWMVRLLNAWSIRAHASWDELVWEAETVIREELDYRIEASNQRRLRRSLRPQRFYVPKVYGRLCGPRVLVMELVPGVLMSDYLRLARTDPVRLDAWRIENDVVPQTVGKRLLRSFLRQSLEDNLFHSDLHPGNLMLLRHGRVALLDCGSVGRTEREFLRRYELFLDAVITGRYATAADVFLLFARQLPAIDLSVVRQELVETIQAWSTRTGVTGLSYDERSTSQLIEQLTLTLDAHGISLIWSFMRIARAWNTMDASLRELTPREDWRRTLAGYFRRRARRTVPAAIRTLAAASAEVSPLELPRTLYERSLFRGTVVRRLAQVFEGTTTVAAGLAANGFKWVGRAHAAVLAMALVVCLTQYWPAWREAVIGEPWGAWAGVAPRLDPQVWFLAFVLLAQGTRLSRRLHHRFVARTGG